MRTKTIFLVVICFFSAISNTGAARGEVLEKGAGVVIFASKDLSAGGRQAAAELARVLNESLGAPKTGDGVKLVSEMPSGAGEGGGVVVWVGRSPGMEEAFKGVDLKTEGEEEILIVVRGGQIAIVGNDKTEGTALAVYTFMQRNLGVRWFWPGELGEEVPQMESLAMKEEMYRYLPRVHGRGIRLFQATRMLPKTMARTEKAYVEAAAYDKPIDVWALRNRLGGNFKMVAGHAFVTWYGKYGKEHPDYFALQPDGTRTPYPAADDVKMCVSNPALTEQMVKEGMKAMESPGARMMVSASENDSAYSGYCTCEACRAWDDASAAKVTLKWKSIEKEAPALTDRYAKFWNRVAEEMRKAKGAQVDVGVWAYGAMRTPPVSTKIDPAVIVGFVGNLSWGGSKARTTDLGMWDAWSKKVGRMVWRPNLFHYGWGMPGTMVHGLSEDFRFMGERGLIGMDIDSIYNDWAARGLDYYALAQLAWDPMLDADALVEDYCVRAFGAAAAPKMKAYFAVLEESHKKTAELKAGMGRYEAIEVDRVYYTPTLLEQWDAMLLDAQKAADGDAMTSAKQKKRIGFVMEGVRFAKAQAAVITAMEALRSGHGDVMAAIQEADKASKERDSLGEKLGNQYAVGYRQFENQRAVRKMAKYLGPVDPEAIARLGEAGITPLAARWLFKTDPKKEGLAQGWQSAEFDAKGWTKLSVNAPWGLQMKSEGPVDLDNPADTSYLGDAWYRTSFARPALAKGERMWLEFPAIDKGCEVYVNGKLVGKQVWDAKVDPDAWNKQRRFDVTDVLTEGENTAAVMVNSDFGQGGILNGAFLRAEPAELLPSPFPGAEKAPWAVQFEEGSTGESKSVPGMYVGEPALRVKVATGAGGVQTAPGIMLPAGNYVVSMVSRVTVEGDKGKALALRATLMGEGQEPMRVWVKTGGSGKWERSETKVTLTGPTRVGALKLFMAVPGVYEVQSVGVRRE